jgi:hypothetical protein
MTWYADLPGLRSRQLLLDLVVLAWVVLSAWLGRAVHQAVQALAAPGRELQEAGDGLVQGFGGAADRVAGVPGVGRALRAPLDAGAGAGELLVEAGAAQQDAVGTLALVLGLVVGGLPVLLVLARWLPGRLRWSREATAARRLAGDVDLLALRAAVGAPLPALARLGPDPVTRWRAGDADAGRSLAALELRRLGLRP